MAISPIGGLVKASLHHSGGTEGGTGATLLLVLDGAHKTLLTGVVLAATQTERRGAGSDGWNCKEVAFGLPRGSGPIGQETGNVLLRLLIVAVSRVLGHQTSQGPLLLCNRCVRRDN